MVTLVAEETVEWLARSQNGCDLSERAGAGQLVVPGRAAQTPEAALPLTDR